VKPNSKKTRVGSLEIEDQGVPLWITPGGEVTYSNPKAPYTKPPSDEAIKAYDQSMFGGVECELGDQLEWDKAEAMSLAAQISKAAYITSDSKDNNTLYRVLKKLGIPQQQTEIYKHWLLNHQPEHSSWVPEMLPEGKYAKLPVGLRFPKPSGYNWLVAVENENDSRLGLKHNAMLARASITDAYKFCKTIRSKTHYCKSA
jgi:hypothetical protein